MQSSTVLWEYFWLTSSTTPAASTGKYKIVSVGKGIVAFGSTGDVSSDIFVEL